VDPAPLPALVRRKTENWGPDQEERRFGYSYLKHSKCSKPTPNL
jgi:hypothetical protein